MMPRLLAILLLLGISPAIAEGAPDPAESKIIRYEAQGGGMLVNAGVDWDRYAGILLDGATVEFEKNWVSDQERLNNGIVRESDLEHIRSYMSGALGEVLAAAISGSDRYTLSEARDSRTLRFTPRIEKLYINAPGRMQNIIGNVLVDSKGRMVLVMEISDAQSGELLASAWRLQVDPDKDFMETATEAGNKTAFKRMMREWSSWFFAMLDHVRTAESPKE